MTIYDPKTVVTDVLLTLGRHKIPVARLDEVLSDIRNTVMNQPIQKESIIGLSLTDYEKEAKRILQELESFESRRDLYN